MATKTAPEPEAEVLEPSAPHRIVTLGTGDFERQYVQKPFGFNQKMQFFGLLGSVLDEAMSGPNPLSIDDLLGGVGQRGEEITAEDLQDMDVFVKAIAKLVAYAPDLLPQLYCIFLNVPKGERDVVKFLMDLPADEGGLTDDDGIGMLETFVDQNWEVMVDFFNEKIRPLISRISSKLPGSQPSKPSKTTRLVTPKR